MTPSPRYPLQLEGELAPPLSRWLWLVKWLLVIPHVIVLAFLWIAFIVMWLAALVAILFTGRYPRPLFDFNLGVLRWTWRVGFYSYSAHRDRPLPAVHARGRPGLPRASAGRVPAVAVAGPRAREVVAARAAAVPDRRRVRRRCLGRLERDQRPRDLDLRRWPHRPAGVIAGIVLLFTGRYPRAIFDFVMGMNRWVYRVAAYAALMTDIYPPFRLDMGAASRRRRRSRPTPPAEARSGRA